MPSGARGSTPFVPLTDTAFLPESQNQSATFRGWRNESVEIQWGLSGVTEGAEDATLQGHDLIRLWHHDLRIPGIPDTLVGGSLAFGGGFGRRKKEDWEVTR